MTRNSPTLSPTRRQGPSAKLKSERIQGAAEKAPAAARRQASRGPAKVKRGEITALLAQMPGWSFDERRSSFHAQVPMGPPVEIPVDGGLIVAMANEQRVEIRLSEGARPWTKAELEGVQGLHRGLAHLAALLAATQEASALARRAR